MRSKKQECDAEVLHLASKPLASKRGCSSAGRAPALQAGGQEFDPPHLHHKRQEMRSKRQE